MEQNVAETEFVSKGEFLHQEVNVLVHLEAVEVVRITLKHSEPCYDMSEWTQQKIAAL